MRGTIRSHLISRLPLVAAALGLALALRLGTPSPPERSEAGVASMLGEAIDGKVEADAFVWEPSAGALVDALVGRRLLFLGAAGGEGPRDVYRARVRVSREGRPIAVRWVKNLTATSLADEDSLVAHQRYVAFVAHAFDAVQGVTVLDLEGTRPGPWAALERWLEVGSARGLGRAHVVFSDPPDTARIELRPDALVMALGSPPRPASLALPEARLNIGGDDPHGAEAYGQAPAPGSLSRTARRLFDGELAAVARGRLLQLAGALTSVGSRARDARAPDAAGGFPPSPIAPRLDPPLAGEGSWSAPAGVASAHEGGEPPLLQTTVRPDPERPFIEVVLVAIDTRQLELGIEAGTVWPAPATGPPGSGRVPAERREELVAVFDGTRAQTGMAVRGRPLVPLVDGAPTVAVDRYGRALLGRYDEGRAPDVVDARQAGVMLLEGGEPLAPESHPRIDQRSGLCRTRAGYLVYGWSRAASARALADALSLAGCSDAIALATGSPSAMATFGSEGGGAPATAAMDAATARFLEGAETDLFYLVRRDPRPRIEGDHRWTPDGGESAPPAWLAAVHRTTVEKLGAAVELHAFAPERFAWQIRPGEREVVGETASASLSAEEQARALVAIGLGVANRRDNQRGLTLDGVQSLPLRPDLGVLTTSPLPAGELAIARTLEEMAPPGDASELVLLLEAGEIRSEARKLGRRRSRAAGCLLGDGTFLVATARADSAEPIAVALAELGCRRAVDLDRGRQPSAVMHRAGGEHPPEARYQDTTLYGMAREASGGVRLLP